jgi:hypothetical protein
MAWIDENHLEQKEQERYSIHGTVNAAYFFLMMGVKGFFSLRLMDLPRGSFQELQVKQFSLTKKRLED